jgi:hypothetical protein
MKNIVWQFHLIEFDYKGKPIKFAIAVDSPDEWTSVTKHRMTFDIHYDEEYGHIVVYRVKYNKADYTKTIHSQPILKKVKQ